MTFALGRGPICICAALWCCRIFPLGSHCIFHCQQQKSDSIFCGSVLLSVVFNSTGVWIQREICTKHFIAGFLLLIQNCCPNKTLNGNMAVLLKAIVISHHFD